MVTKLKVCGYNEFEEKDEESIFCKFVNGVSDFPNHAFLIIY